MRGIISLLRQGVAIYVLWLGSLFVSIVGMGLLFGAHIPFGAAFIPDLALLVLLLGPGVVIFLWLVFVLKLRSIPQVIARLRT